MCDGQVASTDLPFWVPQEAGSSNDSAVMVMVSPLCISISHAELKFCVIVRRRTSE
jgi:hypothetical protein